MKEKKISYEKALGGLPGKVTFPYNTLPGSRGVIGRLVLTTLRPPTDI